MAGYAPRCTGDALWGISAVSEMVSNSRLPALSSKSMLRVAEDAENQRAPRVVCALERDVLAAAPAHVGAFGRTPRGARRTAAERTQLVREVNMWPLRAYGIELGNWAKKFWAVRCGGAIVLRGLLSKLLRWRLWCGRGPAVWVWTR